MVQVDPKLGRGGAFGMTDSGDRVIRMGVGDQLSTLLHEIQHGIQHIERFGTGGSPSDMPNTYRAAKDQFTQRCEVMDDDSGVLIGMDRVAFDTCAVRHDYAEAADLNMVEKTCKKIGPNIFGLLA